MQFMVSVSLDPAKGSASQPPGLAAAEFDAVRGLYMAGILRQIWVRADRSGAIILAEAASAEAAAKTFATLPLVREGIMQVPEVTPLEPYFGFAPSS
jgi:muconolactone delta-isomerase